MSDIDIIMQVEQYPILWDSRLKEFRNKTKQNVAWMMIAEKLNMTADQVIHRWGNIRRQYVRKNKPTPSGSGADEILKWEYYKYIRFLAPVVRRRKTIHNAPSQLNEDNSLSPDFDDTTTHTHISHPHPSTSLSYTSPHDTSQPSTSFSAFETINQNTTTNVNPYQNVHINTEQLYFDDDDMDDIQLSQNTTFTDDISSTQTTHATYNRDTPQQRQPLLLRLTPATNNQFPSIPFQNTNNRILNSSNVQQTPRHQQTQRQQSQTPRQFQTPRQPNKNTKRKIDDKLCKYLENTENLLQQRISSEDEDICFFKGTLSIMKEFSPNKKFRFKQEYMKLLTKFKDEV